MKKFRTTFFILVCLLAGNIAMAQDQPASNAPRKPRWYSDKGFWVVESNLKTPDHSIVRFYNADHKLIYTETVDGVVLNCRKKRTLVKLKRVLEKIVKNYEADGKVMNGEEVAVMLGAKKKTA